MTDAKQIIRESIDRVAKAEAPDELRKRVAGEVDMAYKLDLITYAERDHIMGHLVATCSRRRNELHRAKLARLGIA
jgi:hypothetical protein